MILTSRITAAPPPRPKAFQPGLYERAGVVALIAFASHNFSEGARYAVIAVGLPQPLPAPKPWAEKIGDLVFLTDISGFTPFNGSVTLTAEA